MKSKKTLPSYTSIGGYPILYVTSNGSCLCAECAADTWSEDGGPANLASDVYWEGAGIQCDGCNSDIESAYGPITEAGQ